MSDSILIGVDKLFKRLEFDMDVVYDIGSYKGEFTTTVKEYLPNARYHLFEPNIEHNDDVVGLGQVHNIYLSNEEKDALFWGEGKTSDSFYEELTGNHKEVKPKLVRTHSLDKYVKDNNLEYPNLIKIDTQGSELDILAGGLECLDNAVIVVLEYSILPFNNNKLSPVDYINFMYGKKYMPFHIIDAHSYQGALCQIDLVFINRDKVEPLWGQE